MVSVKLRQGGRGVAGGAAPATFGDSTRCQAGKLGGRHHWWLQGFSLFQKGILASKRIRGTLLPFLSISMVAWSDAKLLGSGHTK